MVSIYS
jgi:hypothetical protein